jgi:hypothetical protein
MQLKSFTIVLGGEGAGVEHLNVRKQDLNFLHTLCLGRLNTRFFVQELSNRILCSKQRSASGEKGFIYSALAA